MIICRKINHMRMNMNQRKDFISIWIQKNLTIAFQAHVRSHIIINEIVISGVIYCFGLYIDLLLIYFSCLRNIRFLGNYLLDFFFTFDAKRTHWIILRHRICWFQLLWVKLGSFPITVDFSNSVKWDVLLIISVVLLYLKLLIVIFKTFTILFGFRSF